MNSTIYSNPSIPIISQSGGKITSSSASGNQWFLNSVAISGSTSQTYTATQTGYYSVVVINSVTGCSSSSAVFNFGMVGIKEAENVNINSAINIYPNPSNSTFNVQFPATVSNIKINLVNVLGQSINFTEIRKSENEMMIENVVSGAILIDNKNH